MSRDNAVLPGVKEGQVAFDQFEEDDDEVDEDDPDLDDGQASPD